MITYEIRFKARDARFIAPMGLATPHASAAHVAVDGARMEVCWDPQAAQPVLLGTPEADEVVLRTTFTPGGPAYPEALFQPRDNRYTRSAAALVGEASDIAAKAGGGRAALLALMRHTAELFDYGHVDEKFYDGHEAVPHLCGTTRGSCVDINVYLLASLRAAGIEAGYVYGIFVPEEKRDWASDGHCWVVTRCDGVVEEWDIAHHLKLGTRDIRPALNPRPGVRLPMSHGMGWSLPQFGISELKVLPGPIWLLQDDLAMERDAALHLTGYDELAAA